MSSPEFFFNINRLIDGTRRFENRESDAKHTRKKTKERKGDDPLTGSK